MNIPRGTIHKAIISGSDHSAWAALQRGEINIKEFGKRFTEECSKVVIILCIVLSFICDVM